MIMAGTTLGSTIAGTGTLGIIARGATDTIIIRDIMDIITDTAISGTSATLEASQDIDRT